MGEHREHSCESTWTRDVAGECGASRMTTDGSRDGNPQPTNRTGTDAWSDYPTPMDDPGRSAHYS
jgi:hypothetical protein